MRRYLVFYRLIHAGIEVVRLLHGSRDVAAMFNEHPAP
jgi:plasmid stabilization system protein ParE